jgi:hypothetical protein
MEDFQMTDAPRVSENVIRQLRFIIADQLSIHRDLVTQPMTLKTPSWEALRDMCDELLALRTPAQEAGERKLTRDEWRAVDRAFWASVNDASPAVSEPAEPVSKSVAKRTAAQKGEPYPFTAEPVFTTDFQDTGAPLSDLVHRKPAPATGLTREEVDEKRRMYSETELAALYEMSDSVAVKGAALRNLIDDLRNLAARK